MKKLSVVLLVFAFATVAYAGFTGPRTIATLKTVASVNSMQDDDKITLEGYLVKEIRSEHYMFRDATGEIEVEIDNEDFRGVKATPETKIRIVGEVDKDRTSITVDVDYVEAVK